MKAPDTIRLLRDHFADIPASEREVLLIARIVLHHLAECADFAQLANGYRLRDGLDFTAWLRELEAAAAGEIQAPGVIDHSCPDCHHEHEGRSECQHYLGEGRFCLCESKVRA